MARLHDLHQLGQSTWLNYLRNSFIRSGELAERVKNGIQGLTTNAQVYERAVAGSSDYDAAIRRAVSDGQPARLIHEALMVDDIQRAADVLHPVFEQSNRRDGFVSYELDPALLVSATTAVAGVRHFSNLIDRFNVMAEVPATTAGVAAIRALVADGVSVNATHLFSVADYEAVADAYIDGLREYVDSHSVWRTMPTAVASFSLAPIDAAIDAWLSEAGRPDLRGKTAVALAKALYARFRELFTGPEWERLAAKGARSLRPKWTRVAPADFQYKANYYVNQLVGLDTIVTLTPGTLDAFLQDGQTTATLVDGLEEAKSHLAELRALGLDLDALTAQLQRDHLLASDKRFHSLVQTIIHKRDEMDSEYRPITAQLGAASAAVDEGLQMLCRHRIICRIWSHDHTVWKPEPTEITNRLGWLHIMNAMADKVERLKGLRKQLVAEGYTHALLLGMGGSSLAPELFQKALGRPSRPANLPFPYLDLVVVDTTDADAVRAAEAAVDLGKTIIIVSTKSGGTVETLSAFKYFYNRLLEQVAPEEVGRHFIGITDGGSKITELGARYGFRDLFLNDPNIGGRYSALSYFGLLPAALVGVDVADLLERAAVAAANATVCHCEAINDNHAAFLGAALGRLGLAGRDKVTFLTSPALASFGDWAEQLIAESLGKEGKGILPVVGEPPALVETYGADRLFVNLKLAGDRTHDRFAAEVAAAGHPVITLNLKDLYDIGGQFVLWEMATAVAGHFLGINPFDQPNVEEAKIKARAVVAEYTAKGSLPAGEFAPLQAEKLQEFLSHAMPGDYVAIQAYIQTMPATDAALQALRQAIHLRTGLATTVGYGPRFLHSTGQLHKGDRGNGLFIQFVSDAQQDVAIPDKAGADESSMSFSVLKQAQALGDALALRDAHRRVITFHVGTDPVAALSELAAKL